MNNGRKSVINYQIFSFLYGITFSILVQDHLKKACNLSYLQKGIFPPNFSLPTYLPCFLSVHTPFSAGIYSLVTISFSHEK